MAEPEGTLQSVALKHGDTFLVADDFGDISGPSDGLYHHDTRYLSRLILTIGGERPSLLGSSVRHDNVVFTAHMTNRPLPPLGGAPTPEGVIHVKRARLVWEDHLYEAIELTNFASGPTVLSVRIAFASDFADIFEVRGMTRAARGHLDEPVVADRSVRLRYRGLDDKARALTLAFGSKPDTLDPQSATFTISLGREQKHCLFLEAGFAESYEVPGLKRHRDASARACWDMRRRRRRGARVRTLSPLFNTWLDRSRGDLALLTTELPTGPYPYAGIPWFSTPFGRDAIVTALQMLWLDPALAKGVLRYLGANQATETNPFQDAHPGKIMHETRRGEMAALGEVPFGRYYGGVDTTPLYVVLAGAYIRRTGDRQIIDELWPVLVRAMAWVTGDGDSNRDGLVDYISARPTGLANQGWKDSTDSIFHRDGTIPSGPISLVEVQGFAYAACLAMADISDWQRDPLEAERWREQAAIRAANAEDAFWDSDLGTYGIALDGEGDLCRVQSSNAGQLLYSGLPTNARASKVIQCLLTANFASGSGTRTLAVGEARYNPMSYHNGSIWPHDTALCASGMARYGERDGVQKLMDELFAASNQFGMRLPELYCGFPRRRGEPVIAYPVACLPQAWSSGAAFMMLEACLGISIDGWAREIVIRKPMLPTGVDQLTISGIVVAGEAIDLSFERSGNRIIVNASSLRDVRVVTHL